MSETSTWMPLSIGDYLKNTQHLSAEEHGAYLLLIMHYWIHGKIKNDKKLIKNITKISAKKCENILQFFEEKDGYLIQERIEEELTKAKEKSEKAKKSAEARWGKNQKNETANDDANAYANASPEHMLGECSSPSPNIITKRNNINNAQNDSKIDVQFEEFWKVYGNKIDKKVAKEKFKSARKIASIGSILLAAGRYKKYCEETDTPMKHPKTWLNGECWKNDYKQLLEEHHAKNRKCGSGNHQQGLSRAGGRASTSERIFNAINA